MNTSKILPGRSMGLIIIVVMLVLLIGCAQAAPAPASSPAQSAASQPSAAPAQVYEWRHHLSAPPKAAMTKATVMMMEDLNKLSGGNINIRTHESGELGKTPDVVEMCRTGDLDIVGAVNLSYFARYEPWVSVDALPYIYQDAGDAWQKWDTWLKDEIATSLEKHGFKLISLSDIGYRNIIGTKRPITKLEDFKGLKYRSLASPLLLRTYEAWGAKPVQLSINEVFSALETGTIDALDIDYGGMVDWKFAEVAKYVSESKHQRSIAVVVMNLDLFNSLPADIQDLILYTGDKACLWVRVEAEKEMREKASVLINDFGVEYNVISADEVKRFKEASKPVYEWAAGEYSKEIVEKLTQ